MHLLSEKKIIQFACRKLWGRIDFQRTREESKMKPTRNTCDPETNSGPTKITWVHEKQMEKTSSLLRWSGQEQSAIYKNNKQKHIILTLYASIVLLLNKNVRIWIKNT